MDLEAGVPAGPPAASPGDAAPPPPPPPAARAAVVEELLAVGACSRCVLRLADGDGASAAALLDAPADPRALPLVRACLAGGGEAGPTDGGGGARKRKLDGAGGPADGGSEPASCCPLCLGLLQALDAGTGALFVASHPPALTADALAAAAAAGGTPPAPAPDAVAAAPGGWAAAAAALAAEWEFDPALPWALDVSVPAAAAGRHAALGARLARRLPGGAAAAAAALARARSVKDALRAGAAARLAPLLPGRGLHAARGRDDAPPPGAVRVSIGWHCASDSVEAEGAWLAPPPPPRRRRQPGRARGAAAPAPPAAASAAVAARLAGMTGDEVLAACPSAAAALAPVPRADAAAPRLSAGRGPVHVGGRYVKAVRGLPHSPWVVDGGRRGGVHTSVQEELAAALLPPLAADAATFLSAGREDADVRCLGAGRPFGFEVLNARRLPAGGAALAAAARAAAAARRGAGVAALGARRLPPAAAAMLREAEQEKVKRYAALCWAPTALAPEAYARTWEGIVLEQQTPVRVLHRRANLARERAIHRLELERVGAAGGDAAAPAGGGEFFVARLEAAAGTYVKEFVHGDFGRTRPSLRDLLGRGDVEIAALDVVGVDVGGGFD